MVATRKKPQSVAAFFAEWAEANKSKPGFADLQRCIDTLSQSNEEDLLGYMTKDSPTIEAFRKDWTGDPHHFLSGRLFTAIREWLPAVNDLAKIQAFVTAVVNNELKLETVVSSETDQAADGVASQTDNTENSINIAGHAKRKPPVKAVIMSCVDNTLEFPFVSSPEFSVKRLFIRSFYDPFIDDVFKCFQSTTQRRLHTIVTGNPGIGKSAFGAYLLVRALQMGRPVVYEHGAARGACYLIEHGRVTEFERVRHPAVKSRIRVDPQLLYIADSSTPFYFGNACTTVLITSPLLDRYKEYQKQLDVPIRIFPVFLRAEAALMHQHCFPEISMERFNRLYELWGGIPRKLFFNHKTPSEDSRELKGLAELNPHDVFVEHRSGSWETAAKVSHKIFHVHNRGTVEGLSPSDPDFYKFSQRSLSTVEVENFVKSAWTQLQAGVWASIVTNTARFSIVAAIRGLFHEDFAINVLRKGGEFPTRPLQFATLVSKRSPLPQPSYLKLLPCEEMVEFDSIENLRELYKANPDRFFRPLSQSFCAVDLILPMGLMVQFTVSDTHGLILESKARGTNAGAVPAPHAEGAVKSAVSTTATADAHCAPTTASRGGGLHTVAEALGLGVDAEIPIYFGVPADKFHEYPAQSMTRNGETVKVAKIAEDPIARRVRQHVLLIPSVSPVERLTPLRHTRSFSTNTRSKSVNAVARRLTVALYFFRR